MSGKKITGIILAILGLIGSYYYIGGYLELKNQFGNVFGMADKVLNTYLPMMIASVAFFILGIFLLIKANQEEMNDDSNINSSQSKLSRLGAPHPDTHVKCPDCRGFVLMEASACQHCGCKLIPQGIVQTSNNNLNLSPKQGPSFSLQIFDGDKSLENDAYKIYLVKKYGIEKNDALGKVIVKDKLFKNIDEALNFANSLEKSFEQDTVSAERKISIDNHLLPISSDEVKSQEITKNSVGQNETSESYFSNYMFLTVAAFVLLIGGVYFYNPQQNDDLYLMKFYKEADRDCIELNDKNACTKKVKLAKELESKGYCWGRAELKWFKCN